MITLTREEAQQVLDALKCIYNMDKERIHHQAIAILRARLAQPEREWQGLTDEERRLIRSDFHGSLDTNAYCRAIEAKLKQKNA